MRLVGDCGRRGWESVIVCIFVLLEMRDTYAYIYIRIHVSLDLTCVYIYTHPYLSFQTGRPDMRLYIYAYVSL